MKWEPQRTKPDFGPVDCSFLVACIFDSASEGSAMFLAGIRRDQIKGGGRLAEIAGALPKGAMRGWPAAKKGAPAAPK
jgi:hypothetical protein